MLLCSHFFRSRAQNFYPHQQAKLNGTSPMPIPHSCHKLFKFVCVPTQRERSIGGGDWIDLKMMVRCQNGLLAEVDGFTKSMECSIESGLKGYSK